MTAESIIEALKVKVLADLSGLEPSTAPASIRATIAVGSISPLPWLHAQKGTPKLYIGDRDGRLRLAAVGSADTISSTTPLSFTELDERIQAVLASGAEDLRYFGGSSFLPTPLTGTDWEAFGCHHYHVPRFELHLAPDQTATLACNVVVHPGADLAAVEQELQADFRMLTLSEKPLGAAPVDIVSRRDQPDQELWQQNITDLLTELADDSALDKVVMARETCFQLTQAVAPCRMLDQLMRVTPGCLHFLLQLDAEHAFIGATPEILYHRKGDGIETAAIAGTRRRGKTPEEDEKLTDELLANDKERREHLFVMDRIRTALDALCLGSLTDPEVAVLKLSGIQHLCQFFRGRLLPTTDDGDLLEALHPTPAVGGVPTAAALDCIASAEPFRRGWYASPLGWFGADSAGFAVGIRSALLVRDTLRVYAGAGIVNGSDPEREWVELENKISGFMNALAGPDNS